MTVAEQDWAFFGRRLVQTGNLNHNDTLFGGTMLAWIDEEIYIYAKCQLGNKDDMTMVTARFGEINFRAAAFKGNIIEFGMKTKNLGRTSITVDVLVRNKSTHSVICEVHDVTFVCVDPETMKPIPHGCLPEN
ncbi:acyl-CoA thioesterase [Thalassotalea euphylliae]|uniref:Acyl-CoA thioesterase n=1 Tax=Thalassotalea euphylliae TaxID=1655234 RepID=A0A3E0TW00_9GAMM|nr:hotdog domain-containing protein [Thalassotalea euphylliae]REL28659.1 acyl-CoA thioesterase [Thalassotalea euphylliae]